MKCNPNKSKIEKEQEEKITQKKAYRRVGEYIKLPTYRKYIFRDL